VLNGPGPDGSRTAISSQRPSALNAPAPKSSCTVKRPSTSCTAVATSVGPICVPPAAASISRNCRSTGPLTALFWNRNWPW
jgi:hypothetical protein